MFDYAALEEEQHWLYLAKIKLLHAAQQTCIREHSNGIRLRQFRLNMREKRSSFGKRSIRIDLLIQINN